MLNQTQNVLSRLAAADREHQKESGARFLLGNVRSVCLFILAAFLLDVVFHLGAGWRLGLFLTLIAGVIGLLVAGWHRAFVRRNRLEHIARLLETRDPALGSRLINLLQLRGQSDDASLAPLTRELAGQAVENYAGELGALPLETLARTGEWRRQLRRAAGALLGFAALLAVFFRITPVEFARFTDPFGDHPPYSFTQLAIVSPGPAGTNVLYGKGFVVKVKASGHQPKEVLLTAQPPGHPEQAITLPMFDKGALGFDQLLDNVRTNLIVFAHTRNGVSVSKQVPIGVILTPQLEQAYVQVTPPAYTGLKAVEKPYAFNGLQALSGSELRFRLQSNRPLREGRIEITTGDPPLPPVTMKKTAENEVSAVLIATESGRLRFTVADVDGFLSQGDCQGALTVTYDLPPEVRIAEPDHDAFVAMDFKLKAQVVASDDYGLRLVRLHRGLNGVFAAPKVVTYDPMVRDSVETVDFDFAGLGVEPGDIISLFAEAVDTAPDPHLSRSQTVRLQVIGVEEYNNFLREQTDIEAAAAKYAALNEDLQQLVEEQQKLGDAAQKLAGQLAPADPKQSAALVPELDALLAGQNELDQKLNHQAERMENFVREHPLYDVEQGLQGWLRQQAENVRRSADTNAAAARDIAQRSAPSGGRSLSPALLENFRQESDAQVSRLGGVHDESEKQIVQALDNLAPMQELMKDFNQFELLYRTQQELAAQTRAYDRPGQLGREDQLALADLAATEKQVADLLRLLGDKLRDDAADAKKLFPKAAQSGQDLADRMADLRLHPLAEQATGQMLAGNGDQSFNLADRLRGEMEKLFADCQGGNCPSSNELDAYLRLQRMNPGNSFAQMSRSRKFGSATGKGSAPGQGQGEGAMGTSGYAVMDGGRMEVMGNESSANRNRAASRQSSRLGKGAGGLAGGAGQSGVDKPDVMKGLNPVNRQSGAVSSETTIEEYNDVVENYFQTITARNPQPAK